MNPSLVILTTFFRPVMGGVESNAERLARYLSAVGFPVVVVTKRVAREWADEETSEGLRVVRIGPYGARDGLGKWKFAPAATRWLIAHKLDYDVVCCIDFRGIGLAGLAARTVTGRPVLFQAQTPGVFRWPLTFAYKRPDAMACIGRELEREALALGMPRDKVHFLPNAIDMRQFRLPAAGERDELRRSMGVPLEAVVCAFLGRLSLEKGLMDLMEAWRAARPAQAVLLVAGPDMDGNAWNVGPAAREFVAVNGLQDSVKFLGAARDPGPLLRAADVFVQPSHFEAQGLSAVEALASGLPVIASATGGLLDFVRDGENGLLAPPKDPPALAERLGRLVSDAGLRQRLAAAARPSVERDYDERLVFGRFGEIVRALAEDAR
ncbi:MAG TPA: glycosyltransferase family 4 protein [Vicinamibacterales bacterium]|jgi:glycosyltransferase involved in cell wall biosynthesis|nr:glycosyltransferase family 4 protein [Vicinamibacterales bacterium]